MAKEITLQNTELNRFIAEERNKVLAYLRKTFSVSDDDLSDIYQESSVALFVNIRDGKLSDLTSTLSTYFLRICINQTLKFMGKQKKAVPLFDDSRLTNKDSFRPDKIDELYQLCTEDEEAEKISEFVIEQKPAIFAINYCPTTWHADYLFLTNYKRYIQMASAIANNFLNIF